MPGPPDWFTGDVTVQGLFHQREPGRVSGANVRFEAGARTAWHTHPLGQTLIVTEGEGWIQTKGEERRDIQAGDVVTCPPEVTHWHGARKGSPMAHIAVQEALDGKAAIWHDHVTDAEYAGDDQGNEDP